MSQPPYQPGSYGGQQPGWGQQPGPGQQPGGYPQQGGQPQSGGFPQPGGYPQGAPPPGQQPGGYDPYGQYGQYGQQPQYGQPNYYGPQKKSPLPWILGGGGVVVIAIVVVLILVLSGGSDTSSPQGMSEEIARVVNERDVEGGKKLYCEQKDADKLGEPIANLDKIGPGYKITATAGNAKETGETGTAEVNITATKDGKSEQGVLTADLKKKDGAWCVVSADLRQSRSGGSGG
jgi:hypothetical protein